MLAINLIRELFAEFREFYVSEIEHKGPDKMEVFVKMRKCGLNFLPSFSHLMRQALPRYGECRVYLFDPAKLKNDSSLKLAQIPRTDLLVHRRDHSLLGDRANLTPRIILPLSSNNQKK